MFKSLLFVAVAILFQTISGAVIDTAYDGYLSPCAARAAARNAAYESYPASFGGPFGPCGSSLAGPYAGLYDGPIAGPYAGLYDGLYDGPIAGRYAGLYDGPIAGRYAGLYDGPIAGPYAGLYDGPIAGPYAGLYDGPIAGPYAGPYAAAGYVDEFAAPYDFDVYTPGSLAASNGGGLMVTSSSPIAPTGVTIISENAMEGPLAVSGQVPFLGTIALEGALPTAGAGAVIYGCGNGEIAIIAEELDEIAPAYSYDPYRSRCGGYGYRY